MIAACEDYATERLLRAQLLQIFYSIRSERLLMEQLDYNLLFRWFVGMDMDEPIWAPTVFTKNRDRLLNQEIARSFFRRFFGGTKHSEEMKGYPEADLPTPQLAELVDFIKRQRIITIPEGAPVAVAPASSRWPTDTCRANARLDARCAPASFGGEPWRRACSTASSCAR